MKKFFVGALLLIPGLRAQEGDAVSHHTPKRPAASLDSHFSGARFQNTPPVQRIAPLLHEKNWLDLVSFLDTIAPQDVANSLTYMRGAIRGGLNNGSLRLADVHAMVTTIGLKWEASLVAGNDDLRLAFENARRAELAKTAAAAAALAQAVPPVAKLDAPEKLTTAVEPEPSVQSASTQPEDAVAPAVPQAIVRTDAPQELPKLVTQEVVPVAVNAIAVVPAVQSVQENQKPDEAPRTAPEPAMDVVTELKDARGEDHTSVVDTTPLVLTPTPIIIGKPNKQVGRPNKHVGLTTKVGVGLGVVGFAVGALFVAKHSVDYLREQRLRRIEERRKKA